jgi:hypothetical protein
MKRLAALLTLCVCPIAAVAQSAPQFRDLFNGKDLTGDHDCASRFTKSRRHEGHEDLFLKILENIVSCTSCLCVFVSRVAQPSARAA